MNRILPFCAIVGQEDLKKAIILNLIDPKIGGILIRGEKGTAKSTIVRSISTIFPEIPIVTLPLNATEDRLVGGIDIEKTIKTGKKEFSPGLFFKANGGILYIDEINLLDRYLAELILDVAESGINRVEREGISFVHEARFILIGTMNPEEGELDPQLLDRFGLCVEVRSEKDIKKRVDIIKLRERFDSDPESIFSESKSQTKRLRERILASRKILKDVSISDDIRFFISELSLKNNVQGHRADILMERTAKAYAAFKGKEEVSKEDVLEIADFVLLHRKRIVSPPKKEEQEKQKNQEKNKYQGKIETQKDVKDIKQDVKEEDKKIKSVLDKIFDVGETFKIRKIETPKDRLLRKGSGRRSNIKTKKQGRYIKSSIYGNKNDIAFDATIRAAAPYQLRRGGSSLVIRPEDLRYKIREKKTGNLLIFVVDASGSMGAYGRMKATKGAIMSILMDAYQKRDRVAMITFRKDGAQINLPPTSSVELAARLLKELPVGGKTPLSSGIIKAYEVAKIELLKDPNTKPILFFITDGKANVSIKGKNPLEEAIYFAKMLSYEKAILPVVIDTEQKGLLRFELARKLAKSMNALYFNIETLRADTLLKAVKEVAR